MTSDVCRDKNIRDLNQANEQAMLLVSLSYPFFRESFGQEFPKCKKKI
jgi:hypothetical protein